MIIFSLETSINLGNTVISMCYRFVTLINFRSKYLLMEASASILPQEKFVLNSYLKHNLANWSGNTLYILARFTPELPKWSKWLIYNFPWKFHIFTAVYTRVTLMKHINRSLYPLYRIINFFLLNFFAINIILSRRC